MYTPWILFTHSFIAGLLMPWVGLLLVNIRPKMRMTALAALGYALVVTLVRQQNIGVQLVIPLQMALLAIIISLIWRTSLVESLIATVFGTLILASGEAIFLPIIIGLSGLTLDTIMHNRILMIFMPLPQILITLIIIRLCSRFHFHLFDFKQNVIETFTFNEGKRKQSIIGMAMVMSLVILVQLTFSLSAINQKFSMFKSLSPVTIEMISVFILLLGLIAMGFFIRQLVDLTKKESQYHMQFVYMETIDELYTAIRSERHDIVNHLQTVYGFTQLGLLDEVDSYLRELLGGGILSNDFVITGTPGLTALFYIKSGIARTHEIQFKVTVDKDIKDSKVPPYELNTIIGNLINNAFDAVMSLEISQRIISVYIGTNGDINLIKVSNYGFINEVIKQNLLKKGYSTKQGEHSGLGLYICNNLLKKYGGSMRIDNNNQTHMVEVSVFLPIIQVKEELHELSGQKNSAFAD